MVDHDAAPHQKDHPGRRRGPEIDKRRDRGEREGDGVGGKMKRKENDGRKKVQKEDKRRKIRRKGAMREGGTEGVYSCTYQSACDPQLAKHHLKTTFR